MRDKEQITSLFLQLKSKQDVLMGFEEEIAQVVGGEEKVKLNLRIKGIKHEIDNLIQIISGEFNNRNIFITKESIDKASREYLSRNDLLIYLEQELKEIKKSYRLNNEKSPFVRKKNKIFLWICVLSIVGVAGVGAFLYFFRNPKISAQSVFSILTQSKENLLSSNALIDRSALLISQGQYEDAIPILKDAQRIIPDRHEVFFYLAECYRAVGAEDNLIYDNYVNAIKFQENQSKYYYRLGNWLMLSPERRIEAEENLKKSIEKDNYNFEAYSDLGWIYIYVDENYGLAREILEKGVMLLESDPKINDPVPTLYKNLGVVELYDGNNDAAINLFITSIMMDKKNLTPDAHLGLAQAYQNKGFTKKACWEIQTVIESFETNSYAQDLFNDLNCHQELYNDNNP